MLHGEKRGEYASADRSKEQNNPEHEEKSDRSGAAVPMAVAAPVCCDAPNTHKQQSG